MFQNLLPGRSRKPLSSSGHSFLAAIITLLTLAATLSSCNGRDRSATAILDRADILMNGRPDSALTLVGAISPAGLSPAVDSRRRLLLVKASMKSEAPALPDSILLPACDYYSGRGDSLEVQTLFYRGEQLFENSDYEHALIPLHDAYHLALRNSDHFYAAMAARTLCIIYGNIHIMSEALKWSLRAKELFEKAGKPVHAEWMKDLVGKAYTWTDRFDEALRTFDSVDSAQYSCPVLRRSILEKKSDLFARMEDYRASLGELMKLRSDKGSLESAQWSKVGENLLMLGDLAGARQAIDSARISMSTARDSLFASYILSQIYAREGRFEEACKESLRWGRNQMRYDEYMIERPQILTMSDYFMMHTREQEARASQARTLNMALLIVASLLIVIIILTVIIFRSRLRNRRESEARLIVRLSRLEKDISDSQTRSSALKAEIDSLFREKFALLDSLCNAWYRNPEGTATNAGFRREIVGLLSQMQSVEMNAAMERLIDSNCDGWMSRFRTACPDLKPWQYQMTMYLFVDFSIETIAILLSKPTLNSTYAAKSNLKKAIISAAPAQADSFLKSLGFTQ